MAVGAVSVERVLCSQRLWRVDRRGEEERRDQAARREDRSEGRERTSAEEGARDERLR